MPRYRKISTRLWGDEKFRRLSAPNPNAQSLWLYLLTGPHTTSLPGLFRAGQAMLAEELGWPIEGFISAWKELESIGCARADWHARVVWIPKAIKHNEPESPNVVANWRYSCDELPECELLRTAIEEVTAFLTELGPAWIGAWILADRSTDRSTDIRPARITREVASEVRDRDKAKCRYCGGKVNWQDRKSRSGGTFDHVDPTGPATVQNIVTACRSCNSTKGFRTPEQAGMNIIRLSTDNYLIGKLISTDSINNQEQEQEQEQDIKLPLAHRDKTASERVEGFEEFWKLYPRKVGKAAALKAWTKHCTNGTINKIRATLAWEVKCEQWTKDGGQYIPHPATWINQERWNDEPLSKAEPLKPKFVV